MKGYGQYCPIAKAAEVFAERWTPLVVRNLYLGAQTFSEILEGVPRMSRTLLADRRGRWSGRASCRASRPRQGAAAATA